MLFLSNLTIYIWKILEIKTVSDVISSNGLQEMQQRELEFVKGLVKIWFFVAIGIPVVLRPSFLDNEILTCKECQQVDFQNIGEVDWEGEGKW